MLQPSHPLNGLSATDTVSTPKDPQPLYLWGWFAASEIMPHPPQSELYYQTGLSLKPFPLLCISSAASPEDMDQNYGIINKLIGGSPKTGRPLILSTIRFNVNYWTVRRPMNKLCVFLLVKYKPEKERNMAAGPGLSGWPS